MSEELRILIVDDDRRMARTLLDILKAVGYEPEAAHSGPEALEKIAAERFDCVLTDVKMPEMDGVELCRAIKNAHPELPVVFMTAYSADRLVKEGLEEGAVACLAKPLDVNLLLSFFSFLREELCLVIVDDDPRFRRTLGNMLRGRGFDAIEVGDPRGLAEELERQRQVVLLNIKLEHVSGLELLKEIRGRHPDLQVVLVTSYREEMAAAIQAGLKMGAYDCVYKPLEMDELLHVLAEIRQMELGRHLRQASGTPSDELARRS